MRDPAAFNQSIRNKVVQSDLTFACLQIFHKGKGWGMGFSAEKQKKEMKNSIQLNSKYAYAIKTYDSFFGCFVVDCITICLLCTLFQAII